MAKGDSTCSFASENTFGPTVANNCYGGFDFTLLFEESILNLLPLGIAGWFCPSLVVFRWAWELTYLVVWAVLRIARLRQETTKVQSSWILASKIVGQLLVLFV